MKLNNRHANTGGTPDRPQTEIVNRRTFLLWATAAGIGLLPLIQGCKEATMDPSRTSTGRVPETAAPVIPPIDLAAPAATLSATFGMG